MCSCRGRPCSPRASTASLAPMTTDACTGTTAGPGANCCTTPVTRPRPRPRSPRCSRPASRGIELLAARIEPAHLVIYATVTVICPPQRAAPGVDLLADDQGRLFCVTDRIRASEGGGRQRPHLPSGIRHRSGGIVDVQVAQAGRLSNVRYDIRGPVLRRARQLQAAGHEIIKLNLGNPAPFGLDAPDDVLNDVVKHIADSQGYSDARGIEPARQAVAQFFD